MSSSHEKSASRVGEVVTSLLTVEQFLNIYGAQWILADGRSVVGTRYEALIGPFVPDLRGVFLRGKNYDRSQDSGNAAGDLPLGTHQEQAFQAHWHEVNLMFHDDKIDGVDSVTKNSDEHHLSPAVTGMTGGDETRPNNVTVNFFVCIN